jgi:hypothetical protein
VGIWGLRPFAVGLLSDKAKIFSTSYCWDLVSSIKTGPCGSGICPGRGSVGTLCSREACTIG